MSPVVSILMGLLLLGALFRLGSGGERRFLGKSVVIMLAVVVLAVLVLLFLR